ncbi:MAG: hypothetical protein IKK34_00610 [Clostridia bacterium]|nr:hypothetical protein [Clostridia bacterium]
MNEPIRLTNKTAIALRRNARKVRAAYRIAACALSAVLAVAGIWLGLSNLLAVPVMVAVIVLMDCVIILHSRSRYLSLLGQAICTEAAAQEIRVGSSEKSRRERAISDLMGMKADLQRAESRREPGVQPFFEQGEQQDGEEEDEDLLPVRAAPRRRRRTGGSLQLIKNEAK